MVTATLPLSMRKSRISLLLVTLTIAAGHGHNSGSCCGENERSIGIGATNSASKRPLSAQAGCSRTAADVRLAHDIYGPEVSARQRKARPPKNAADAVTKVSVPLYMQGQQNL